VNLADSTHRRSLGELLREAIAVAPVGVDALDAELLLAHTLGHNRAGLYARLRDRVEPAVCERFDALWRRRCAGEPCAYLIGEREFHGRRFGVAPEVLIPRPDTETLLDVALARWPAGRAGLVVDAGTGSGVLAVSFQLERPHVRVCAVDTSAGALEIARANARRLGAPVCFWRGDWLDALADHSVDLLLANPPYLAADDPHLPGLLASGEPRVALVAGAGGLRALERIADAGTRVLRPGAWLLLEHGQAQGAAVRDHLRMREYREIASWRDLEGRERVSGGCLPGATP